MGKTTIGWTQHVWNPTRGCSMAKGSEKKGCLNCYAARQAARGFPGLRFPDGKMAARILDSGPRWTGRVELISSMLEIPLRRKMPTTWFVNSMSDLFHESLPDEAIDQVFAVMALCPQHTFQCLTKRAERLNAYLAGDCVRARIVAHQWEFIEGRVDPLDRRSDDIRARALDVDGDDWPLPNVWLGVSVEDQETADARIPHLLRTPAAIRFVSYEPALGPVDFNHLQFNREVEIDAMNGTHGVHRPHGGKSDRLDLIIVGGESGPGARPFDFAWARSVIAQCRAAGVACFVKQLGRRPIDRVTDGALPDEIELSDKKGENWDEWPNDLRIRQMPVKPIESTVSV